MPTPRLCRFIPPAEGLVWVHLAARNAALGARAPIIASRTMGACLWIVACIPLGPFKTYHDFIAVSVLLEANIDGEPDNLLIITVRPTGLAVTLRTPSAPTTGRTRGDNSKGMILIDRHYFTFLGCSPCPCGLPRELVAPSHFFSSGYIPLDSLSIQCCIPIVKGFSPQFSKLVKIRLWLLAVGINGLICQRFHEIDQLLS